jgi:hypothetical protein
MSNGRIGNGNLHGQKERKLKRKKLIDSRDKAVVSILFESYAFLSDGS